MRGKMRSALSISILASLPLTTVAHSWGVSDNCIIDQIHGGGGVAFAIAFSGFYCDSVPNLKRLILLKPEDRERVKAELRDHPEIADT